LRIVIHDTKRTKWSEKERMSKKLKNYFKLFVAGVLLSTTGWSAITINEVRIENLQKVILDPSFVQAYISLKAGQEVESEAELNAAVATDVDNLRRSDRFSFVRAFVEKVDGDWNLVYSVAPRQRLQSVEIVGADGIGNRKVKNELGLELGDYVDEALVGEKARGVEAYFRKNKYPDASVAWELTAEEDTGAATVTLIVDEGEKLRVKRITMEGDHFLSDDRSSRTSRFFEQIVPWDIGSEDEEDRFESRDVRRLLNQKKTWWITSWFGAYQPEMIDTDLAVLRKFYLDHGFLDVVVSTPEVEKLNKGKLELTYKIEEGEQYRIGSIDVEGADLFEPELLKKQLLLKPEDIASKTAIDNAVATVTRYYGNRGYIRSYVEPVVQADPQTLRANILFRIREGALASINEINIRGNEKTRDEVMRRELAVFPGETFHQQRVETSESRLRNLGYFQAVESDYIEAEGTNTYDLTFDVKEKAMGSFLIGAGFSSVDSLVGFAEMSHGNFDIKRWPPVGDGQKMKVRVQAGAERQDLEVSFIEPWFMDRKLALGVSLYSRSADYYSNDYSLGTTGGSVSLSKPLSPFIRGKLSYSLEQFDVDVNSGAVSEIDEEDGKRIKSTLGMSVSRDTRDQFYIPTRGNRTSVSAELSGGPLLGETDIYFLEVKSSHFFPVMKEHVLNLRGAIRFVESYDGDEVPIFDRLFLGGPRSIRGFPYRDVGPRSEDTGRDDEPIGGKSSYYGTAEYTVPLWNKVRGATFYDIGSVNESAFDIGSDHLNSSYGVGVRFDLPMFPLQLDYAFPHITDDENDDAGARWNFLLGYSF
jgi:outer membrane protein insertion porin family